jgi:hypothetical protein
MLGCKTNIIHKQFLIACEIPNSFARIRNSTLHLAWIIVIFLHNKAFNIIAFGNK